MCANESSGQFAMKCVVKNTMMECMHGRGVVITWIEEPWLVELKWGRNTMPKNAMRSEQMQ